MSEKDGFSSSSETEWLSIYNALLKEHVTFPSREPRVVPKAASHRAYTVSNSQIIDERRSSSFPPEEFKQYRRPMNASEARELIKSYHTLREQMTDAEQNIFTVEASEKLQHIPTLKKYLTFSERYLEKLVCTQVAVKKKQDKVIKIMNYN